MAFGLGICVGVVLGQLGMLMALGLTAAAKSSQDKEDNK